MKTKKTSKKMTRQERRRRSQARRRRQRWISYSVVGAVLLVSGLYLAWPRSGAKEVPDARLADNPWKGSANPRVTLTEFGDFGCPSCRAWHQAGVIEQILERYGEAIRFEWRDFPVITPRSPKAAEAGQCAYDQGKFWEFHDYVYEQPDAVVNLSREALGEYAAAVGLDMQAFNTCLDSGQHEQTVKYDWQQAMSLGLRGTPSFLVNDTPVLGGSPDLIVQAIEAELGSAP